MMTLMARLHKLWRENDRLMRRAEKLTMLAAERGESPFLLSDLPIPSTLCPSPRPFPSPILATLPPLSLTLLSPHLALDLPAHTHASLIYLLLLTNLPSPLIPTRLRCARGEVLSGTVRTLKCTSHTYKYSV